MNNQVRLVILFSERCAYRIAPARGLVFFGALSTSSLGHATRGYQPVPPCGLHEVFLGRLVAWCAWEPDATQPITYMRDRRTVKMAYRDIFFFCSGFSFVGVSRRLGYHPPPVGCGAGELTPGTCAGTSVDGPACAFQCSFSGVRDVLYGWNRCVEVCPVLLCLELDRSEVWMFCRGKA